MKMRTCALKYVNPPVQGHGGGDALICAVNTHARALDHAAVAQSRGPSAGTPASIDTTRVAVASAEFRADMG